jgi:hypothetical protein
LSFFWKITVSCTVATAQNVLLGHDTESSCDWELASLPAMSLIGGDHALLSVAPLSLEPMKGKTENTKTDVASSKPVPFSGELLEGRGATFAG